MDLDIDGAKGMKNFIKKLSLTQQLFMIIIAFVVIFSLFFFMFLSWNIDSFVHSQMYSIIKRTQNNIIYNYKLDLGSEVLYGANDPNIVHVIYTNDRDILTSSNLPVLGDKLIDEIFRKTENQSLGSQDYVSETDHRNLLFSITKIDRDTNIVTAISNAYRDEFKSALLNSVVNILVIVAGVLFLLMMIWVAYIIHPLNQIRSYIDKLRKGEQAELKIDRQDEIGEVATAIVMMNEELVRYNRQKDELIHNISHDLKTPITTIRSYSESIKDGIYPYETLAKSVDVIIEHANRLEKKVQSLLMLNRVGYLASEKGSDITASMKHVIESAILSLKVVRPEIKIETNIDDVTFIGLEESWRVVMENLLDNALRYARSRICIQCRQGRCSVYNDGPTVSQENISNVFEAYEKGDDGQFGLGLAIVKKVATSYGYKVYLKNHEDGVEFIIEDVNLKKKGSK
jgi:two-component system sensor histidine kinase CssS